MNKKMEAKYEMGIVGLGALVTGWCGIDFAHSYANYRAQANAITDKVYSAANTITPEVVENKQIV